MNLISGENMSTPFIVTVLDPCDFTVVTPNSFDSPIIYQLYDPNPIILDFDFTSSEENCGDFIYQVIDLSTLNTPDSSTFTISDN